MYVQSLPGDVTSCGEVCVQGCSSKEGRTVRLRDSLYQNGEGKGKGPLQKLTSQAGVGGQVGEAHCEVMRNVLMG